mgnify:CR=1 FL=1
MKKNDVVTVEVTDIGIGGEGIGKVDGYTLFIKDAVIGDTVEVKVMKAKKNYGYARLMRIVKESAFRVSARCPEARRCGGCQIQEMDYRKQLEFKNTKVRNVPEGLLKKCNKCGAAILAEDSVLAVWKKNCWIRSWSRSQEWRNRSVTGIKHSSRSEWIKKGI